MKRIGKKIIPLFIALLVLVGVPLSSYEEVRATGAEEFLYYTYWDLLNSVFAAQGYKMSVKDDVVKNHGVTGKQVWNNFKTWVKVNAQDVYKELTLLPKAVTSEGIKMSQGLWNAFSSYAKTFKTSLNVNGLKNVQNVLVSVTGIDAKYFNGSCLADIASGKNDLYCLNFIGNDGRGYDSYYIFGIPTGSTFVQFDWNYYGTRMKYILPDGTTESRQYDILNVFKASATDIRSNDYHDMSWTFRDYYKDCSINWIIKGNHVVGGNYVLVAQGACPAEVPDVTPWIKNPDIPDEWRIVHPNETPDPDDDNDGDALPVVIPIHPTKPDKPSETETEESTEKSDKDKSKDPSVIINPSTGNQIDPNTGLDIDPDTGYLIDPDTGDLIDPNTGKKVDKNKIKNRVKNLPSIASGAGNITKYFPFCIPWDMIALIKSMNASKKAPVFHFEHYFEAINYNFVIDVNLEDYWKYIKIFRWGMTIFFVIGLFFVTVKFTTFVYRMGG